MLVVFRNTKNNSIHAILNLKIGPLLILRVYISVAPSCKNSPMPPFPYPYSIYIFQKHLQFPYSLIWYIGGFSIHVRIPLSAESSDRFFKLR